MRLSEASLQDKLPLNPKNSLSQKPLVKAHSSEVVILEKAKSFCNERLLPRIHVDPAPEVPSDRIGVILT